jgi:hypothetical protein
MIAAVVPDLMDRSRFADVDITFIRQPADTEDAELVVVDLDRCSDVAGFGALQIPSIGFGAHVDAGGLQEARAAGFDRVVARSEFFRRLPEILSETMSVRIDPDAG